MIIIDCNHICHKVKFALINVPLSVGEYKTEIIFGFLRQLLVVASELPNEGPFVFTWDSHINNRKKIYPEYKKKRKEKKKREEIELENIAYDQFAELRLFVLPSMGFKNIFIQRGYEADDLIASITKNEKYNTNIIIVSNDQDLYQLLGYEAMMFDVKKRKLYAQTDFEQDYGIHPEQWARVKALAGCSSDNVKGLVGIGEKTAIKFMKGQLKKDTKQYETLTSNEALKVETRNLKLVALPLEGTNKFPIQKDCLYRNDFVGTFERYRLNSFLQGKSWTNWEKLFQLKLEGRC